MSTRLTLLALFFFVVAPLSVAAVASGGDPPVQAPEEPEKRADYAHLNLSSKGLAIEGYDPVAYFQEGGSKPRKGDAKLVKVHRGVTYRFANQKNLTLFEKDPERYEPAYGGWCAYAMAKDDKVDVDPESYLIQNGKLMLFYKSYFNNTRKTWMKKPKQYERKASANWKKLVTPPPVPEPAPK